MDSKTRRDVLKGTVAVGAGVLAATHGVRAQPAWPGSQTIKFIVPYPPAGATDIVGRAAADGLGAYWKTSTVVDNVAGAGANIGMERVAKGVADGTQILIVPPNITTNQFLYKTMPFNPETDIVPVSQLASLPNLLCIRKGLPIKSVSELIAYAKANPGKLNFASSGVGTTIHLSGEMFKKIAGVDMVHVAYRGSAPAVNDMIAGHVDVMFDNLPSIGPQAAAGNVIGLAITSKDKSPFAPQYPTVSEVLPGFDVVSWFGVGLPAKAPQAIVEKLEADVIAVCKQDDYKKRLATQFATPVGSTRKEFAQFIVEERKRWGDLITELKIKVD